MTTKRAVSIQRDVDGNGAGCTRSATKDLELASVLQEIQAKRVYVGSGVECADDGITRLLRLVNYFA